MKQEKFFIFSTIFLFNLIFLKFSLTKDQLGCNGLGQPPFLFYENKYLNGTIYTEIPDWAQEKMQKLIDLIAPQIYERFPPNFPTIIQGKKTPPGVYFSIGGRSAFYLRLFKNTGKVDYLKKAKEYIDQAILNYPKAYNPSSFSFLKGRAGVLALGSVIYDILNRPDLVESCHNEIIQIFDNVSPNDYYDIESGYSGLVYIQRFLKYHFLKEIIPKEKVEKVEDYIFQSGLKYLNRTSGVLRYEIFQGRFFTGMGSHGNGSPLFTMLLNDRLMNNETIKCLVQKTVDYDIEIQTSEGQIPGDYPDRTQWCHGAPGILPIFGLAYERFKDEKYLKAGLKGCDFVSKQGIISKGFAFCHGIASNIFMMIDFYRRSKSENSNIISLVISMILSILQYDNLTSLDSSQWEYYDCVSEAFFGSPAMGLVLLCSEVLKNIDDLSQMTMVGFHDGW